MTALRTTKLGRIAYEPALAIQEALVQRVRRVAGNEAWLLFVEHDPPVITIGRGSEDGNVLLPRDVLEAHGFELHESSRGGDVTYHGPGQQVGYLILDITKRNRDLHRHLRDLEEVIIRTLADFEIPARRVPDFTGAWTDQGKVAAIGVAVRKWVTYHGFALNVCPDLTHFQTIVPCGISDKPVTSMHDLQGRDITLDEVQPHLARHLAEVFNLPEAEAVEPETLRRLIAAENDHG